MQFKRIYKLIIGEQGGNGNEITELKIHFTIDKDLSVETNKSIIEVFNLADSTRNKLDVDDLICILEVGYESIGTRRIFIGNVTYLTNYVKGADLVTKLELSDGQTSIRDTIVSLSYGEGTSTNKIIADIAGQMGLNVFTADDVDTGTYPNGFSFVGLGRDALSKVTAASGAEWSIQNNTLQIISSGGSTNIKALSFSAESGLIESPHRINRAPRKPTKKASKKYQKKSSWKIKTLLAPTANVGDYVKVESIPITGWFTIESLKHNGDNYSNEWYTEMELIYVGTE